LLTISVTEMLIGLRALLCNHAGYPVSICLPETKHVIDNPRNRLDVLIYNRVSYVLELCANVDPSEIRAHIAKTAGYH
jgi:hypothetical protein